MREEGREGKGRRESEREKVKEKKRELGEEDEWLPVTFARNMVNCGSDLIMSLVTHVYFFLLNYGQLSIDLLCVAYHCSIHWWWVTQERFNVLRNSETDSGRAHRGACEVFREAGMMNAEWSTALLGTIQYYPPIESERRTEKDTDTGTGTEWAGTTKEKKGIRVRRASERVRIRDIMTKQQQQHNRLAIAYHSITSQAVVPCGDMGGWMWLTRRKGEEKHDE